MGLDAGILRPEISARPRAQSSVQGDPAKTFQGPLHRVVRETRDDIRRNYINETVIKHPNRAEATRTESFLYAAAGLVCQSPPRFCRRRRQHPPIHRNLFSLLMLAGATTAFCLT